MKWKGRRQSTNIEDMRDLPKPKDDIGDLLKQLDEKSLKKDRIPTPSPRPKDKSNHKSKVAEFQLKC